MCQSHMRAWIGWGERRIEKTEVLEMKYKKFMGRDLYAFCCRSEADLSSEMVSEG